MNLDTDDVQGEVEGEYIGSFGIAQSNATNATTITDTVTAVSEIREPRDFANPPDLTNPGGGPDYDDFTFDTDGVLPIGSGLTWNPARDTSQGGGKLRPI